MDPQETAVYQLVITAALVIGGILIYSMAAALQQQARYSRSQNHKIESEINTLENERKRIAADLHDDLGPVLSAAKMKLAGISTLSPEDEPLLSKSMEYIENITGKIRGIAGGLMPAVLLDKGPVIALQQYINNLSLNNKTEIVFNAGQLPPLNQQAAIHVYRIIQEIIHNCCKHAGAKRLQVNMHTDGNRIILATADDGRGFNQEEAVKQAKGYGLLNIQSRVQLLNGNLNINAAKGTKYFIEIPLAGNIAGPVKLN